MKKLLSKCNNHYLFECKDGKIMVTTDPKGEEFNVNEYGIKQEIIDELTRWKNEVDQGNEFMLEMENTFINVLQSMEKINGFVEELKSVKTYVELNMLSERVNDYSREQRKNGMKNFYPELYYGSDLYIDKQKELDNITVHEKIKLLQGDKKHVFSGEEFMEMLEYAKIKPTKSCSLVDYISNKSDLKICSSNRNAYKGVFNTLDKLISYAM